MLTALTFLTIFGIVTASALVIATSLKAAFLQAAALRAALRDLESAPVMTGSARRPMSRARSTVKATRRRPVPRAVAA